MAAARFAAVLLVVLAATLAAQDSSTGQVVITVVDTSGAVVPNARIGMIQLPSVTSNDADWLNYALHAAEQGSVHANAYGEATVAVAIGSYALSITAPGFRRHLERTVIQDGSKLPLRVALVVDQVPNIRGDCMSCTSYIPLEHAILNTLIPLEPLHTIALTTTRVRRR